MTTARGFVIGCDANYVAGIAPLLASLRVHHDEPVTFVDGGVSPAARNAIGALVDQVIDLSALDFVDRLEHRGTGARWLTHAVFGSFAAHLAGYERFVWLDIDTLVLDRLDAFFDALDEAPFAGVQAVDGLVRQRNRLRSRDVQVLRDRLTVAGRAWASAAHPDVDLDRPNANSGAFAARRELFASFAGEELARVPEIKHYFQGGDEALINWFLARRGIDPKWLPARYNVQGIPLAGEGPASELRIEILDDRCRLHLGATEIAVAHFSTVHKPWTIETSSPASLAWRFYRDGPAAAPALRVLDALARQRTDDARRHAVSLDGVPERLRAGVELQLAEAALGEGAADAEARFRDLLESRPASVAAHRGLALALARRSLPEARRWLRGAAHRRRSPQLDTLLARFDALAGNDPAAYGKLLGRRRQVTSYTAYVAAIRQLESRFFGEALETAYARRAEPWAPVVVALALVGLGELGEADAAALLGAAEEWRRAVGVAVAEAEGARLAPGGEPRPVPVPSGWLMRAVSPAELARTLASLAPDGALEVVVFDAAQPFGVLEGPLTQPVRRFVTVPAARALLRRAGYEPGPAVLRGSTLVVPATRAQRVASPRTGPRTFVAERLRRTPTPVTLATLPDPGPGAPGVLLDRAAACLAALRPDRRHVLAVGAGPAAHALGRVRDRLVRRLVEQAWPDLEWHDLRSAAADPRARIDLVVVSGEVDVAGLEAIDVDAPIVAVDVVPGSALDAALEPRDVRLALERGIARSGDHGRRYSFPGILALAGALSPPVGRPAPDAGQWWVAIAPAPGARASIIAMVDALVAVREIDRVAVLAAGPAHHELAARARDAGLPVDVVPLSRLDPALVIDAFAGVDAVITGHPEHALLAAGVGTPAAVLGEVGPERAVLASLGVTVMRPTRRLRSTLADWLAGHQPDRSSRTGVAPGAAELVAALTTAMRAL